MRVARAVQAGKAPAASPFWFPGLVALVFFAFHIPYLPASLEDLDSINFALGVREFNVTQHQPHPPGYPVYIFIAKGAHALIRDEAAALSAVGVVAAALGVLAMAALYRRFDPAAPVEWSMAATVLATTAPLYWFSASRPLSDATGLAAALAIQALTLSATRQRTLNTSAACAGLAAGIRSQVIWLTVPLLVYRAFQLHDSSGISAGSESARSLSSASPATKIARDSRSESSELQRPQDFPSASFVVKSAKMLAWYSAGALLWAGPLVVLSGGPAAYLRALTSQGTEDFTGVRMLVTSPSVRELVNAAYYSFVAPWGPWPVAASVLVLSAAGVVVLIWSNRRAVWMLAMSFGPYFVFHIAFQETFTGRYALPLVVPIAYCAMAGARLLPRRSGLAIVAAIAVIGGHVGGTSVAAYSRDTAPAFRLLDDMREASTALKDPPVLALDRREEFDMRRPIRWIGAEMPALERKLAAPAQHEWLELVKYWNSGGRAPVWLVVDPMRNAVDLIGRGTGAADPMRYRWRVPYPTLLSGVRPNEMDWYRITRPEWYAGEGWALTPEAAGVSEVDGRGLSTRPIEAWIGRETFSGSLVVGGRNLDPAARPRLEVLVNDRLIDQAVVAPGFFLRFLSLASPTDGSADFAKVTMRTIPPSRVAIEQFDASSTRALFGYGQGWHEPEFNPRNGLRWRWLSERGELRVRAPAAAATLTLHLEGESPGKYFSRGSRLVVRAGQRAVFDQVLSSDFSVDAVVPATGESGRDTTITLETDQVFIPAEHSWRPSGDRRHLGLRIFKCEIR